MSKVCPKCGQAKEFSCFYNRSDSATGKSSHCRSCVKSTASDHYYSNIHEKKKYAKNYYERMKHMPRYRAAMKARSDNWRSNNWDRYLGNARKQNKKLRFEFLVEYGEQCTCCGERNEEFLTLEHVGLTGAAHRKEFGNTGRILRDLRRRGWPKDGYTINCYNCNWAKRFGGPCPHENVEYLRDERFYRPETRISPRA